MCHGSPSSWLVGTARCRGHCWAEVGWRALGGPSAPQGEGRLLLLRVLGGGLGCFGHPSKGHRDTEPPHPMRPHSAGLGRGALLPFFLMGSLNAFLISSHYSLPK